MISREHIPGNYGCRHMPLCGFVCPNKLFVGVYRIRVGWVISGLESMYIDKNPSCSIAELWFISSGRLTIGSQARSLKLWVA